MTQNKLKSHVMQNVIIGYQYDRYTLFDFLKECEKNNTQIQDDAFTYFYDGTQWIQFDDRRYGDGYCFDEIECKFTRDAFIEHLLNSEEGRFWIVQEKKNKKAK